MRTKLGLLMVFALALALTGCKSSEERAKEKAAIDEDQAKLQGKWKVASLEGSADEEAPGAGDSKGEVYVIDGDIMKVERNGDVQRRQKLTLNPLKDPKEVDLVLVNEDGSEVKYTSKVQKKKGGKKKTTTTTTTFRNKAIYKIEGDKLTFCIAWSDQDRPKDFTSGPTQYVLKLAKRKDGSKDEKKDEKKDKDKKEDDKKEDDKKDK